MESEWIIIGLLIVVPLVAAIGFAPRRTEVVEADLRVHTWLKTFHFDLKQVKSAEDVDRSMFSWTNTVRICGVGWPLKPYGWFWNRERGIVLAMVSDHCDVVLLNFGKKLLLVSPKNHRDLILELQDRRAV